MVATVEDVYRRLGEQGEEIAAQGKLLAKIDERQENHHQVFLEKIKELHEALHGNGKPGLIDNVRDLHEWKSKVHWMAAGGMAVITSIFSLAVMVWNWFNGKRD